MTNLGRKPKMNYKKIFFSTASENDGNLTFIEGNKNIPFEIKRVYQIYGIPTQDIARADRANTNTFLFYKRSLDDGFKTCLYDLNEINEGILIHPLIWMKTLHFLQDTILQVRIIKNANILWIIRTLRKGYAENEENCSYWSK